MEAQSKNMHLLIIAAAWLAILANAFSLQALEWKTYSKNGEPFFRIPAGMKQGEAIRGAMSGGWDGDNTPSGEAAEADIERTCHKQRIAQFARRTYHLAHHTSLSSVTEAAKMCGHPELAHAGIIYGGISAQGRHAMKDCLQFPERTLAVYPMHIGDSRVEEVPSPGEKFPTCWATGNTDGTSNGPPGNLKRCEELRAEGALVTPHNHLANHNRMGPADYLMLWLEQVMKYRVPQNIPTDGSKYSLLQMRDEDGWVGTCKCVTVGNGFEYVDKKVWKYSDFPGDPNKTSSWFPNEIAAKAWLTYDVQKGLQDYPTAAVYRPVITNTREKTCAAGNWSLYTITGRKLSYTGHSNLNATEAAPGLYVLPNRNHLIVK